MSWSPSLPSDSNFYKYEPFNYTFTGGSNFTVSGSSLVTPFCTVTPSNVVFSSGAGFQTTGSFYGEPLNITSSLGVSTFTLFLNAGRFATASNSVIIYQNEATSIPLTPSVSIATAFVTPTLPLGLAFRGSGTAWNIVGTATLTSASSNYLFYGSNTTQAVSTYITLQVSGERFTLSPSNVTTSLTVGTPISPITITNNNYPITSTSVSFALSGLPSGLSGVSNGRTYVISGTPDASNLVPSSNTPSYISITLNAASRTSSILTASTALLFNYTPTVLFTSPPQNTLYSLYSNIAITPIEVTARTFFPYSSTITSLNAVGLPTGLTLSNGFIRGSPTSSGGIVTLSATNSNGIIGTTRITVAVNQVTINVSPSVTTLQTYIVGQAIPTVTFTVTSPAYANIDLNDPTWTSTILNLPPGVTPVFNGNTVTLNGVPILSSITTGRQLTLSVLSPDQTRSSGTFRYKVDPDEFTFIPSTSSYIFAQNVTITPIQINVTTKSGSPVRYYTSVDLPVGLYISAAGLIQGTPLQSGSSFLSFNANNGYTIAPSPQTLRYTTTLDVVRVVSSNTSNVLVAGTSSNLPIALTATTVSGFSVAKLVAMNYLYGMAINLYSSGYPIKFDSNGVPFTYSANGVQTIAYSTIVDKFDSNGIPITVNSSGRFVTVYSFGTPSNGWTQRVSYGGTPPYTVYTYSNGNTITAYSNISNAIDGRVTSCVSPAIVLPPKTIIKLIGSNIIGGETTTSTTEIELQGTGTQVVTRYVLKGNPYSLYTSTDGENYSLVTTYSSYVPHEFQWNSTSNVFLIADGSSTVYSNSVPVLFDQPVSSVTYGDRWYAAGNNVIFASPDGTNWTTINFSGNVNIPITSGIILRGIGDRIVLGSALGEFNSCLQYFDTNGEGTYVIYQATPSDILSNVNAIYTGSRLIAAGAKGTSTLCYSSDGITWLPCSNDFTGVAYDVVSGAMNLGLIATGSNLVGGYSIKYSTDGIAWYDVVGLPTFANLGPIQWDGTSWVIFVDSNTTYRHDALVSTILDATTWELTTISFPSSGTVHLFPKPIYGTVAVRPTPTLVIGVTSVGPAFISPTKVDNAYQYVPITPIIFDAGPGVVFFLASTLPRGMSWNTNIPVSTNYYRASITGQSVQIGTFQITVYAQSPAGITRKTVTIVVSEVFTSVDHATAAAYTAYTREKVIADAVVNARDNRVLPSSVGPFLLDRPKDVETVVICCD